jgi:cell division protease FtsH
MDTLDHAILRPGRFTRKVNVPMPDIDGRRAILGIHAVGKPLENAVDMEAIARRTAGMSGAQLADLLNESAIYAARRSHEKITPVDVHDGWLKSILGTSRKRSMDERERSIIAAHEAGHAVCGRLFGDRRRVEEISLFAHGDALGVTVSSSEDDYLPSESDLRARLVALMGGRAAEAILFEDVTGGASNDLEKASEIATRMVTQWGMGHDPDSATLGASGRGTLSFRVVGEDTSLSVGLRAAVDRTINAILDQAYTDAREALLAEMRRLTRVAAYLYEHERIDGAQFEALFDGSLAPSADVETQWRSAKSKPRSWDEIDDLIAMAVATAETSTVARAAAPQPNRPKRGGRRTHPRPTLSSTRALLVNWWQRGSRGVDRPAD